ncbi:MAG TPA: phosphatidylglycerophosphatase A [Xanthomonadales bacterium]|nr:phosphatidylglycerophosphatase A [Xanthomonadales bacterium]
MSARAANRLTRDEIAMLARDPAGWVASGLGGGFSPFAPGTVGSLFALAPWLLLRELPWQAWLAAIVVLFALGTWAADRVIAKLGRQDPGVVVVDEWVGQWLALAIGEFAIARAPHSFGAPSLAALLVVGFLVFRLCDIAKPWPASWADRKVKGGFGTMLDDAFAGIWAGALMLGAMWLVNRSL